MEQEKEKLRAANRESPQDRGNIPTSSQAGPHGTTGETPPSRKLGCLPRNLLLLVIALTILAGGAIGSFFGYNYWLDQRRHVFSDNAQVAGVQLQVGSLNAGKVNNVTADIGDRVNQDQVLATVVIPSPIGLTTSGTAKMGIRDTSDQEVSVRAPFDGVVAARQANPGDTVAAGQPILSVVDPTHLWIQAQIEETAIGRVHPGQPTEVKIDSLDQTLAGRVSAVGRATTASSSAFQGLGSTSSTKVTQLVPVKIEIDYGQLPLILGSSASVKIRVEE